MKHLPKNTLAYFSAAPQTHLHDFSALQTAVLAESSLAYKKGCSQTLPNDDAVTFYTLNHCASVVRKLFTPNEPLPEWAQKIMQTYTQACLDQGERMLHYILCITTREMRHLKSCTPTFWTKVEKEYDLKSVQILKHISSDGGEETAMNKYLKTPPDMSIGQYVKTLSYGFHNAGSSGWSGGYGGHPWGEVTDAAVAMLTGATSMEMLVDTGYTLAHNGGPIFNKTDVKIYLHQDVNSLMTILDVQRSGQMLDLMLETQTHGVKKTAVAEEAVALLKAAVPSEVKGYIDWKLVDALRPDSEKQSNPHKYVKQTVAQKQPMAAKPKAKPVKPVVPSAPKTVTFHGKTVKVINTYQVYPHQTVNVVERAKS